MNFMTVQELIEKLTPMDGHLEVFVSVQIDGHVNMTINGQLEDETRAFEFESTQPTIAVTMGHNPTRKVIISAVAE